MLFTSSFFTELTMPNITIRMKTALKYLIIPGWILIALSSGKAQDSTAYSFNLNQALKYALSNSIEIQKSILDQQQATYKVNEVRSQALPQINGSGQLQYFPNLPTQLLPGEFFNKPGEQIPVQFGTDYNLQGGFDASQILFNQSVFTGLKAANTSEELYKLLKIQSDEDVIYQVASTYYRVLELQAQINALDSNIVELGKLADLMKIQYQNQLVTKTDYSRIMVNKTNMETNLQSLHTARQQQINMLKVLIGMDVSNALTLQPVENLNQTSMRSLQYDYNNPIQMQLLQKQTELNMLNRKAIQGEYYPTLALFAQQSWSAQRNEFNFFEKNEPWFQQTIIGVKLSVPIFDGLNKRSRVQQSEIDIHKLQLDQVNTKRQLDVAYQNAKGALVNSIKSVEAQKQNEQLAQEVYQQTSDLYREQVGSLTDLLNAENGLREAQINYRRELLKYRIAELDVLKAQGQLKKLLDY